MEKRKFGRTGWDVSVIGFGAAPIGYLATEQDEIGRILNLLLDEGVNLIDTAASYPGSEEAIGKAVSNRREEFVLVTKCGDSSNPRSDAWKPEAILQTVDQALERLRTDRLDVMLLHSCSLETLKRGDALGALIRARDAGKIRFCGYSGDNEAAAFAAALADVAVIETSINLCDQMNIDLVLPVARQRDAGVIAKRPIANAAWKKLSELPGLYAGYARIYNERLAKMNLKPADLGFDADPREAWPEIALRFTLSQPGVHTAIIGTTNPDHARSNLALAAKGPLPDDVVQKLQEAFRRAEAASGETWVGQI